MPPVDTVVIPAGVGQAIPPDMGAKSLSFTYDSADVGVHPADAHRIPSKLVVVDSRDAESTTELPLSATDSSWRRQGLKPDFTASPEKRISATANIQAVKNQRRNTKVLEHLNDVGYTASSSGHRAALAKAFEPKSYSSMIPIADYDKNPTPLYMQLTNFEWLEVIKLCEESPYQARTWIVRLDKDGSVRSKFLPLHAAIESGAPDSVVKALLQAYSQAIEAKDHCGMLPLHLAFQVGSPLGIIELLIKECPNAVAIKDNNGLTPLALALDKKDKEKDNLEAKLKSEIEDITRGRSELHEQLLLVSKASAARSVELDSAKDTIESMLTEHQATIARVKDDAAIELASAKDTIKSMLKKQSAREKEMTLEKEEAVAKVKDDAEIALGICATQLREAVRERDEFKANQALLTKKLAGMAKALDESMARQTEMFERTIEHDQVMVHASKAHNKLMTEAKFDSKALERIRHKRTQLIACLNKVEDELHTIEDEREKVIQGAFSQTRDVQRAQKERLAIMQDVFDNRKAIASTVRKELTSLPEKITDGNFDLVYALESEASTTKDLVPVSFPVEDDNASLDSNYGSDSDSEGGWMVSRENDFLEDEIEQMLGGEKKWYDVFGDW
jgi:hypothetical protein